MNRFFLGVLVAFPAVSFAMSFEDSFEQDTSGSRAGNANTNVFSWTDTASVRVSNERAYTGNNSLAFTFEGNPDPTSDAWSEQRFKLDRKYTELWFRYRMWVPENYAHRNAEGPGNNKGILNLWGENYSGYTPALSFHFQRKGSNGESYLYPAWRVNGSTTFNFFEPDHLTSSGSISEAATGIALEDRGTWIDWVMNVKTSTIPVGFNGREDGEGNGALRVWKNGELILNISNAHNYYGGTSSDAGGEGDGWNYGYLLGWANSGFDEETIIYIDDFQVGTSNEDVAFDIIRPVLRGVTKVVNE